MRYRITNIKYLKKQSSQNYSFGGHSGEGSVSVSGFEPHAIANIEAAKAVITARR